VLAETDLRTTPRGFTEILGEKPVRPMQVFTRARVSGEKVLERSPPAVDPWPSPPSLEHGALHEPVRPAQDRKTAENALAKSHSPKQFDRGKSGAPQTRRRRPFLRMTGGSALAADRNRDFRVHAIASSSTRCARTRP